MAELTSWQLKWADGWKLPPKLRISGIDGVRKSKPNTIVAGRFLVVSQDKNNLVAQVDGKAGKHPANLRIQRHDRLQDKSVRRRLF